MDTLELAQTLIREASVTPEDGRCQQLIAERLEKLGFAITHYPFGEVSNLWARHGTTAPLLVFAGHTDVVPTGPEEDWTYPPFSATVVENTLYGRGATDMKGAIAAMVCAAERYVSANPNHTGSLAFLITSDEEGPAIDGTQRVLANLPPEDLKMDYCIVGEATCVDTFGDMLKNGRRGSLSATLTIHGKQGHIAYPQLADNPIHRALAALQAIATYQWDVGDEFFPPTSLQMSNIHAGTGAGNVIPGHLDIKFNLRYSPLQTADGIQHQIKMLLAPFNLNYDIDWVHGAEPFVTKPGKLTSTLSQIIENLTHMTPVLSTTGGTSDARFIYKTGAEVIEFGVRNTSAHHTNEHVSVTELSLLSIIYEHILMSIL
ncbi:MAG: succinyl-diaminopimelate desuccinylase [Pseudomonadota bacterium]|nr:succinyl-diaminopimelate desuccinylase [Pseudomonadota bacterium]